MKKQLYNQREAAAFLGVSIVTLHKWDKNGRLVPVKSVTGKILYYDQGQLDNAKKDLDNKKGPGRPPRGF